MAGYFRNSDFKKDLYYQKDSFKENLRIASKAGRDIRINEIRKLNNCPYARKLKGDISIQEIFENNRNEFKAINEDRLRPAIVEEIEKFLLCSKLENGYTYYECPKCGDFYICYHTCKSRFCPKCGKKHRDQIGINVSKRLIKTSHRQLVFTVPFELRKYFRIHRELLTDLFHVVSDTLLLFLKSKAKNKFKEEKRQLGYILFLHTFGRDLKRHPHIHAIFCESYMDKNGELHKFDYLHFDFIRKAFLFNLIKTMRKFYSNQPRKDRKELNKTINIAQSRLKNGAYFYGKKNQFATTIKNSRQMANYLARYASHPAISERRILKFDKETNLVTWFYDPHEDDLKENEEEKLGRQIITEDAKKFMERLIIHIPDKGFQLVRYYGFYANKNKVRRSYDTKKLFTNKDIESLVLRLEWKHGILYAFGYNPLLCKCGTEMEINYD